MSFSKVISQNLLRFKNLPTHLPLSFETRLNNIDMYNSPPEYSTQDANIRTVLRKNQCKLLHLTHKNHNFIFSCEAIDLLVASNELVGFLNIDSDKIIHLSSNVNQLRKKFIDSFWSFQKACHISIKSKPYHILEIEAEVQQNRIFEWKN